LKSKSEPAIREKIQRNGSELPPRNGNGVPPEIVFLKKKPRAHTRGEAEKGMLGVQGWKIGKTHGSGK